MSLTISGNRNDDRLVIRVEGRIDSSNAAEAEQKIFEECGKHPAGTVIVDAEKLEYISSAGLRVLLKLKKEKKDVQIIRVSNDVYEIFEMTGFVDIMDIKKRLRQFSVEGCKLIGQGGFGKVYRYDPETIIKVYRPEVDIDYIKRERQCSKVAFTSGLPTAIAFDVVRVGEAYGVMYELMDADNLASVIANHPDQEDEYIKKYADLAKQIHTTELKAGTLQPASDIFRSTVKSMIPYLSEEELNHYNRLLEVFPERNTLIHGDFHEKNILVRNGELEMIDMGDISQGHPLIELGCVYSTHMTLSEKVIDMPREKAVGMWKKFSKYYFGDLAEETKNRLENVLGWIASMRLLPFLYMVTDPSNPQAAGFIEYTKKQALKDPDEMKKAFDAVNEELFA